MAFLSAGVVLHGSDFHDGDIRIQLADANGGCTAVCLGHGMSLIASNDCTDAQFVELFQAIADDLRRKIHERDHNAVKVPHDQIAEVA